MGDRKPKWWEKWADDVQYLRALMGRKVLLPWWWSEHDGLGRGKEEGRKQGLGTLFYFCLCDCCCFVLSVEEWRGEKAKGRGLCLGGVFCKGGGGEGEEVGLEGKGIFWVTDGVSVEIFGFGMAVWRSCVDGDGKRDGGCGGSKSRGRVVYSSLGVYEV